MPKVTLEIEDSGSATANLILFMNAWIDYAEHEAMMSPLGMARMIQLFQDSSKLDGAANE